MEFRAAHRIVLRDRTNYLIIVLLEEVDSTKPRRRTEFVLTDQCLLEVRQQVVLGTIKERLTTEETGTSKIQTAVEGNVLKKTETFF